VESSSNIVGQDILKILYASEEEKVSVSTDGKLSIVSPSGGVMESTGETATAQPTNVEGGDELME